MFARFPDNIASRHWIIDHSLSLCPASGRFVYFSYGDEDADARVVAIDLIWWTQVFEKWTYVENFKPDQVTLAIATEITEKLFVTRILNRVLNIRVYLVYQCIRAAAHSPNRVSDT